MGYRSEVKICLKKADFDKLVREVERIENEDIKNLINNLDYKKEDSKDHVVIFGWNDIKWYESFPEVQYVMNFLNDLDTYKFVRIGEDPTDIEILFSYGENDDDFTVDRIGAVSYIEVYDD